MRAHRAGGLTKDVVYLRGLSNLLAHLGAGGTLDVLWLGKLPLTSAATVATLLERGALIGPRVRPRYLGEREPAARLRALSAGKSAIELVED